MITKDIFLETKLSEPSKDLYIKNFNKITDGDIKNLKNMDEIKKKLEGYSDNTIKNYFASIVAVLTNLKKRGVKGLLKKYDKELQKLVIKTSTDKNTPNEKENENWLDYNKIVEIKEKLTEQIKEIDIKNITKTQYNNLLKLVVLSLYIDIPPRRNQDYLEMLIILDNKIPNNKSKNYYVFKKDLFIFNKYKTSKSYSSIQIQIPSTLKAVLLFYISVLKEKGYLKNQTPLLIDFNGKILNKVNSITRILNSIFGSKIGSSMLRKIYLSNKYGKNMELFKQLQEDSKLMSHGLNVQQAVYVKK